MLSLYCFFCLTEQSVASKKKQYKLFLENSVLATIGGFHLAFYPAFALPNGRNWSALWKECGPPFVFVNLEKSPVVSFLLLLTVWKTYNNCGGMLSWYCFSLNPNFYLWVAVIRNSNRSKVCHIWFALLPKIFRKLFVRFFFCYSDFYLCN